jgi:hypothetical protein
MASSFMQQAHETECHMADLLAKSMTGEEVALTDSSTWTLAD